jgi:uncharacterized membrane protein YraQ (UPF0718 family)
MLAQLWSILARIILESYAVVYDAGIFLIFGFLLAGILHAFLRPTAISRHLGAGSVRSVLWASLVGVPLPLCSCSVIPVAASLKREGASDGAVTSFLISTPESGVDSIAISWALLDPLMTVFRPVAAFLTALVGGIAQNVVGGIRGEVSSGSPAGEEAGEESGLHGDGTAGACSGECRGECAEEENVSPRSFALRLRDAVRYVRDDLFPSLDKYLFWGFLATGVIAAALPDDFFHSLPVNQVVQMGIMLVVGVPLYLCATASTPVAAALILKGMSPGVALVLLLAGPATNLATVTVVYRMMRGRGLAVYLVVIAASAVLLGLLLDGLYGVFGIDVRATFIEHRSLLPTPIQHAAAAVFLLWLAYSLLGRLRRALTARSRE